MSASNDCATIEQLAGAIAIGEAGDAERHAYRKHLAVCTRCLQSFGGEREIERVIAVVSQAREDESWSPDLRHSRARRRASRKIWSGVAVLCAAIAIVLGVRAVERPTVAVSVRHGISAQEIRALAALDTQAAPRALGRAESLAIGGSTFATVFELSVDAAGRPVHCTIAKSSGDLVLDRSVCRAAMQARYPVHGSKVH